MPLFLLALVLPGFLLADEADPPGRVARLSFISGEVTFQAADGQAPESAVLNRPLTSGDRLMTGADSRSELTFGIAALRLAERSDLSIANLDEEIAQFEIHSGTLGVHVRELQAQDTVQIDAPNSAIRLLEPGDYRVDVKPDGAVVLSVRRGEAEIDAGISPLRVREGEEAYLASQDQVADIRPAATPDAFDRWNDERERQLSGERTPRYVSREVVGHEDLDRYGDWEYEREYGAVWYPRVVLGWSPYRYGHWSWVGPWGWTWIDHAPWGFAPFHYGRWAHVRARWCWVPGPRRYRPVYAPALVAWVGSPYNGISFSYSSRPVSWFPLAPREVYRPWRHVSPRYMRAVNIANTTIVNNTHITNVYHNRARNIRYAHRETPGAVMTRPGHEFDSRRPREERQSRARRDHMVRGNPSGDVGDVRIDRGIERGRPNAIPRDLNVRNRNWNQNRNERNRNDNRNDDDRTRTYTDRGWDRNRELGRQPYAPRNVDRYRQLPSQRPSQLPSERYGELRRERPRDSEQRRYRELDRGQSLERSFDRRIERPRQWEGSSRNARQRQYGNRPSYSGMETRRSNHGYRPPDQRRPQISSPQVRQMPTRPSGGHYSGGHSGRGSASSGRAVQRGSSSNAGNRQLGRAHTR